MQKKFKPLFLEVKRVLLNGMQATKKTFFAILLVLLVLFGLLMVHMIVACHSQKQSQRDYYKIMLSLLDTPKKLKLTDVFDFDFDKAYVVHPFSELYGDEQYFLQELDVDTNVNIPQLGNEGYCRVLFVKNNTVVFDYIYDRSKLCIIESEPNETGIWVYPNTSIALTKQSADCNNDTVIKMYIII